MNIHCIEPELKMPDSEIRPVYLSPHLDDAALSCGGFIHRQARHNTRPLIITCFAGLPNYQELSPFAIEQHQRWGKLNNPIEQRRCEDATAMACLGAEYQHWDYLDCIYRRHPDKGNFLYASEAAIFKEVDNEEHSLIEELALRVMTLLPVEKTLIYAPLAVGQHVDHQLVFQAALRLRSHGFQVQFYEDYPYAEDPQKLSLILRGWISPPSPIVQLLDLVDVKAKITALCFYRSQLNVLFGGEKAMIRRVKAYALKVGANRGYGERYWLGGMR